MSQRTDHPHLLGRRFARYLRGFLAVLMIAVTLAQVVQFAQPTPAAATPGSPGTPSAPTTVYTEDFEHGTGAAATALTSYIGANGETYTADPVWLDTAHCRGLILEYASTPFPSGTCNSGEPQRNMSRLSDVLGQVNAGVGGGASGSPTNASNAATQANHALNNYTNENLSSATNLVQFQTNPLGIVASSTRYYSLSVDVAEAGCAYRSGVNNSRLDFSLVSGTTTIPINASPLRVCTDPRASSYTSPALSGGFGNGGTEVSAGRFLIGTALLTPAQAASASLVMRNEAVSDKYNSAAIDNIELVSTTPQLDQSFSPTSNIVGASSTLTYTITNRSDLGSKPDWSFTDALPSNLQVAPTPNIGGTCVQSSGAALTRTASAGGNTVTVSGGDLAAGEPSCTITVDVTSSTAGTYTNGPGNFTAISGLDKPANASVQYAKPTGFTCTTPKVFVSQGANTQLSSQGQNNSGGSTFTTISAGQGWSYNALGFNKADNLLYAISVTPVAPATQPEGHLLILDSTGTVHDQGLVTGAPAGVIGSFLDGAFDDSGNYWVRPGDGLVYKLDLTTRVATPLAGQTVPIDTRDFTWASGFLWSANAAGSFVRVNVTTGEVSTFPAPTILHTSTTIPGDRTGLYGAAWTYGNGNLGFDENSGNLIQVKVTNPASASPTFTLVSSASGPSATNNDGAACSLPVDLKFETLASTALDPTGASVAPGGNVNITLRASNIGASDASGYVVTDSLPVGYRAVTTSQPGCTVTGSAAAGFTVSCLLGALGAGTSLDIPIQATFPVRTACLTNAAALVANEADTDPTNNAASKQTCATVVSGLSVSQSAGTPVDVNHDGLVDAGDTIQYSFTVTNTGNVAVAGVAVSDPKVGPVTCTSATLAVGASTTCLANAPYVIAAADTTSGSVVNAATAGGTDPLGTAVASSASSTSVSTTTPAPAMAIVANAGTPVDVNHDGLVDAGDTIAYTFTVTNTGNVPLTGITVNDPKVGPVSCVATSLAVGASTTCSANSPYAITAADMAAGSVDNTAVGHATDPDGGPVVTAPSGGSTSTPTTAPAPAISMTVAAGAPADANHDGVVDAGDTIAYTFTVTNTGNVAVSGIAVNDLRSGGVTCAVTSLAPGASTTCASNSPYLITLADEAAGSVDNTAIATGTAPDRSPVVTPPAGGSTSTPATTPVALPQSLDASRRVATPITLTGSDPTGDALTFVVVDQPAKGMLSCAPSGACTYTSAAGQTGSDSFTFRASDGAASSSLATVTISLVNSSPNATARSVDVARTGPTSFDLLGSDANGDTLAYGVVTQPTKGAVTCNAGGRCTYTPTGAPTGSDSFTFTVDDGNGGTATAQMTLALTDAAPVATPGSYSVTKAIAKGFVLSGTDSDLDLLTFDVQTSPTHGSLTCAASVCTYTASIASGTDSFTYTASDGHGGTSAPATVTFTISLPKVSVGDAQVLEPDAGTDWFGVQVPVTLSAPLPTDVTISYFTEDGTATGGVTSGDYRIWGTPSAPLKIKIPAGQTWAAIAPLIMPDAVSEPDENFKVKIASVTAADGSTVPLGDSTATVSIIDNYRAGGDPLMVVQDGWIYEGDTAAGSRAQFSVQFSKPLAKPLTLTYMWTAGTAREGSAGNGNDWKKSNTVTYTVPAGTMFLRTVEMLVWGDTVPEDNETLKLSVLLPDGAPVIQQKPTGTMTILNDD